MLPRIVSVDDHVIEPPNVWLDRLPKKYLDRAPRLERVKGTITGSITGGQQIVPGGANDQWADQWVYDDLTWPLVAGFASIGPVHDLPAEQPITYDQILPGCFTQADRLLDMDANHTEAALCFPTFSRFCGQTFLEREDKDLALLCVKAYNDWMIDEWCGGAGTGRLIPLTIVPLWDANLAAAEIRRCASKGSKAVCFSELPFFLGLPSIHSGYWEPFFEACDETETVINMHIGSASTLATTSVDAPVVVTASLSAQYSQAAFSDWLCSGLLARHPQLKIALSEGQVGWMPYMLERLDALWGRGASYDSDFATRVPERPSSYISGRVYGCIFDDLVGLQNRHQIGMSQIMFEIDYPHADSTFPNTLAVAEKLVSAGGLNEYEAWQLLRGNAIECYDLGRFGISSEHEVLQISSGG
jgi:predicted TIM-barrel fold metal-dependent hydrolase